MEFKDVIYTKEGHIATITLNRPERLNALNVTMGEGIIKATQDADQDHEIWVIILTGAGRAFCAGGDVKIIVSGEETIERIVPVALNVPRVLRSTDKPIIVQINGPAHGYGFDLALMGDIRIASERTTFAQAFVKRGLIPDGGSIWTLPRLLPWNKACELTFLGETIDAKEAERLGLVNKVVPHEELEKATRELANKLIALPPLAVQGAKKAMKQAEMTDLQNALDHIGFNQLILYQSEDAKEGLAAFTEKRQPVFKGR